MLLLNKYSPKCCRTVYEHSLGDIMMWNLVCKNTLFKNLPRDLYCYIRDLLLEYPLYPKITNCINIHNFNKIYKTLQLTDRYIKGKSLVRFIFIGLSCRESYPCQGHSLRILHDTGEMIVTSDSVAIGIILKKYPNIHITNENRWDRDHFEVYVKDVDLAIFSPTRFCIASEQTCTNCNSFICKNHMSDLSDLDFGECDSYLNKCDWCRNFKN